MKLKAAATRTLPPALLEAMNSSRITEQFYEIIEDCLNVDRDAIGPATHFVQETDLTIPDEEHGMGVNVAFTMVSVNRHRSSQDFADALCAIERVYEDMIADFVPTGTKVQLFCVLAVDGEIEDFNGRPTRLLETEPKWVEGRLYKTDEPA